MNKQDFMARCGTSAHATYFIYEHHKVFAHMSDVAIHLNFGSSHISLLCDSNEHMQTVVKKLITDLINMMDNNKETSNDND